MLNSGEHMSRKTGLKNHFIAAKLKSALTVMTAITLSTTLVIFSPSESFAQSSDAKEPAAKESTSKVKVDEVTPQGAELGETKPTQPDTDEVITNRKLRAETGAKKKYSFSASLSYSGGAVDSPFSDTRPNITSAAGTQIAPRFGGTVGGNWRLNSLNSIYASLGVGIDRPFHDGEGESFGDRTSASNPTVGYQTLYKLFGIQAVTQASTTAFTTNYYRSIDQMAGLGLTQTLVYDFGGSKFSLGSTFSVASNFFDGRNNFDQQADWNIGAFPFVEYVISDSLNFRTLIGFMADHYRNEDRALTWFPNTIYQSMGIGISVTRDLFLYPNIQFIPEDIRADRTNAAISANLNL